MKKTIMVVLMLMLAFGLFADTEREVKTLAGKKIRSGIFGGPVVKYTKVDGEYGILTGGRIGWSINDQFSLGLAGYGWVSGNDVKNDWCDHSWCDTWDGFKMGYGGLFLEGIIGGSQMVHLSVGALLGAGGYDETGHFHDDFWDANAFFVFEPEVNVELNITKFFRIGAGVSYRFTSSIGDNKIDNDRLNGFAGVFTMKFGSF